MPKDSDKKSKKVELREQTNHTLSLGAASAGRNPAPKAIKHDIHLRLRLGLSGARVKTAAEKKPKAETKKAEEKRKKSGVGFTAKEVKAVIKKEAAVKETVEKVSTESEIHQPKFSKPDRYFEAVGRRKTAVARVRLYTKPGDFLVNEKLYSVYFPTVELQKIIEDSLQKMKLLGRFRVSIKALGGGLHAQAEACRHGLARCLIKFNPDFRKRLKRAGFLKRDPRMKERKKFGLKGARKAPQWAKR